MRRTWSVQVLFLLIGTALLAACGAEEEPTPTEQAVASAPTVAVEEAAINTPEPVEPTATATEPPPTETVAPTPTSEPTPTEEAVAEAADQCLACHSDKEQLIDTAKPEEKVPSESSGVG